MKNNDEINYFDAYLESRLDEWAEWLKTGNQFGLGYPKNSSFTLIQEGRVINQNKRNCYHKTVESHEQAEEIEKMMAEMSQYKPIMASCLRNYYLDQLSLRSSAKRLNISHTQFKAYVQMGKQWLAGRFNGKADKTNVNFSL